MRIELPLIDEMIPTRSIERRKAFYKWAFSTEEPKLSDIPKLYTKVERGIWDKRSKSFAIPQDEYLLIAWILFLEEVMRGERPGREEGIMDS